MDQALKRLKPRRASESGRPSVGGLCCLALLALAAWTPAQLNAEEIYFAQAAELSLYRDEIFPDRVEQPLYPRNGLIRQSEGNFYVAARRQEPTVPVQPIQPTAPPIAPSLAPPTTPPVTPPTSPPGVPPSGAAGSSPLDASIFGSLGDTPAAAAAGGAPSSTVGAAQAANSGASDLGGLLSRAQNVQSVEVQRRNPVALDPNIRGFKQGQIYTQANGTYFIAARPDLDTQLSKIDPGLIQNVTVIPGPYGVRYGPGFAFIDIETVLTPRYENGFETHFRTNGDIRTNGGQVYGRETVYGGNSDWGFRFSYGERKGSDYEAGNGLEIPSSYHNRDELGEIGYSINPDQRIEFAYQRLDQVDTEYAGQFFDVNFLGFYNFNLRLIDEDPCHPWTKLTTEGWYNRTRFDGNNAFKRRDDFPVIQRIEFTVDRFFEMQNPPLDANTRIDATTNGDVVSSGARTSMLFGDIDEAHLRIGTDFRYLEQTLNERLFVDTGLMPEPLGELFTNLPRAWQNDTGLYAETSIPLTSYLTTTVGGRVDYVHNQASGSDIRPNTALQPGGAALFTVLEQESLLYAFYMTNEVELNPCYTARLGFGHAQRPATLVERYADGLFLGVAQSGFTRVIGDPRLLDERNWQIDLGLDANLDSFRGRANLFHSWVNDYITLSDDIVGNPVGFGDARLLRYFNTEYATLAGFDVSGEYDLTRKITPFASMRYLEGRDQQINGPLLSIPPLDSTVGVRWHDSNEGRTWGTELACRIVDDQDRLGQVRLGSSVTTLEERTPGFSVWHLRGYWNYSETLRFNAGIDNLFDKTYQEHLDLRLRTPSPPFAPTRVLSPGFTPYFGFTWVY